ncbi:MAG: hypothetical protein GTO03_04290, partial [Planctomycetales bacterium]|nr:hypothetical protein [Planctomycetales bacterium]
RRAADYLADPAGVAASVGAEVERVERQLQLDRYRTLEDEMERLSVAYVRAAFADLGWNLRPGEQVTAAALFAGLGVVPAQQALCGR